MRSSTTEAVPICRYHHCPMKLQPDSLPIFWGSVSRVHARKHHSRPIYRCVHPGCPSVAPGPSGSFVTKAQRRKTQKEHYEAD